MTDPSDLNPESPNDQPENSRPESSDDDIRSADETIEMPDADGDEDGENVGETLSTMKWDAADLDLQQTLNEFAATDESSASDQSDVSDVSDGSSMGSDISEALSRLGVPEDVVQTIDELPVDSRASISVIPHNAIIALSQLSDSAISVMVSQPQSAIKALAELPTKALRALSELTPDALKAVTTLPPSVIRAISEEHDESGATLTDIAPDDLATLAEIPQEGITTLAELPPDVIAQLSATDPDSFQTVAELPQELITTLAELPQNVIDMLSEMPPGTLQTIAAVDPDVFTDPNKTLPELPDGERQTLEEVPAEDLQTLAEFPQDDLKTIAELPPGGLSAIAQLPDELRKSLSQFPPNFFNTIGQLSADSLQQLAKLPQGSIETLADLPADAMDSLSNLPQEAMQTLNEIPEDAIPSIQNISQEHVASIASIPSDAIQMFASLPQDAFQSLADVKSDDLKVLSEIAPKTITALAAMNAQQFEALGGLISESFGSLGPDSRKDPSVGSSLKPPGRSDADKSDDDVDWDDDSIERTIESDEWTDSAVAEFQSADDWSDDRTSADSDSDDESSVAETMISDSWSDGGRSDDEAATVESVELQEEAAQTIDAKSKDDDSYSETVVSDQWDDDSIGATLKSDSFSDDSFSRTLEEDSSELETKDDEGLPRDVVRTMQTMWQEAKGKGESHTGKTIKGEELQGRQDFDTGQVIKQKAVVISDDAEKLPAVVRDAAKAEAEYVIEKKLGEGGMGFVWIATQQSISREVAFKTLKGKAIHQKDQRGKFLSEALVTGDLAHPNIVPIYDVGKYKEDELFYAMKKVEGTEWLEVIKEKSLDENLDILEDVGNGVAFAHVRGVIHRDLKPENVMLGGYGEVLVMDWGLAFPTDKFKKSGSMAGATSMGGTPAYMSPEMALGPIDEIKEYSDVYLLGAILFEIITGKPPHTGKNAMKCLMNAARNNFRDYDEEKYSGELMDIAMKAMATNPDDRYQTVPEFQDAIKVYRSHSESVDMSNRADEAFKEGIDKKDYNQFTKAINSFENALELWKGNERAQAGLIETRVAYANLALDRADFDLGLGQLNAAREDHGYQQHVSQAKGSKVATADTKKKRRKKSAKQDKSEAESQTIYDRIDSIYLDLESEKKEREGRVRLLAIYKKVGFVSGVVFVLVVSGLLAFSYAKMVDAEHQATIAQVQSDEANKSAALAGKEAVAAQRSSEQAARSLKQASFRQKESDRNVKIASARQAYAQIQQEKAQKAADLAKQQGEIAKAQSKRANVKADEARENLVTAKENETKANASADAAKAAARQALYEGYISGIGLAAAKIDENSFDSARTILEQYFPKQQFDEDGNPLKDSDGKLLYEEDLRDWEWGRLWHLCVQQRIRYATQEKVNAIAVDQSGRLCFVAGENGLIQVWDISKAEDELKESVPDRALEYQAEVESKSVAKLLPGLQNSITVWSVAVSNDGLWVAAGTNDATGYIKTWKRKSGTDYEFVASFFPRKAGEASADVYSVEFSNDGEELLTASADGAARLWRFQQTADREKKIFHLHNGAVWDASFSPDNKKIVTAGQDANVYVWDNDKTAETEEAIVYISDQVANRLRIEQVVSDLRDNAIDANKAAELLARIEANKTRSTVEGISRLLRAKQIDFNKITDSINALKDRKLKTQIARILTGLQNKTLDLSMAATQIRGLVNQPDTSSQLEDDLQGGPFTGHTNAVFSAVFIDNDHVASAGYDSRVLVWRPDEVDPLNFDNLRIQTAKVEAKSNAIELGRHRKSIRSLSVWMPQPKKGSGQTTTTAGAESTQTYYLTSASEDNTIKLWKIESKDEELTTELENTFRGHSSLVRGCTFSPNGAWVLSGSHDGTLRQWNRERYEEEDKKHKVREFLGSHSGAVLSATIMRDEQNREYVLTAGDDRTAISWNLRTRDLVHTFREGHEFLATNGVFFPNGEIVLTAAVDDSMRVWDVEKGTEIRALFQTGRSAAVAISAAVTDINWIVTGGELSAGNFYNAKLWDAKSVLDPNVTEPKYVELVNAHRSEVTAIAISENSKLVVTGDGSGRCFLWDIHDLQRVRATELTVEGLLRSPFERVTGVVFVNDGNDERILTSYNDGSVVQWSLVNRQPKLLLHQSMRHPDIVLSMTRSADGKLIATSCEDKRIRIWDINQPKLPIAQFSARGELATLRDNVIRVLNSEFNESAKKSETERFLTIHDRLQAKIRTERPKGSLQRLEILDGDQQLQEFLKRIAGKLNGGFGRKFDTREFYLARFNSVSFSKDGSTLVGANSDDGFISFWDVESQRGTELVDQRLSQEDGIGQVWVATLAPDSVAGGRVLIVGGEEARLIDRKSKKTTSFAPHGSVNSAAFDAATCEWVVTAGSDYTVRIWNNKTSKVHLKLEGHKDVVNSAVFSPDKKFVLTASNDKTVRIWHLDWESELKVKKVEVLEQHQGAVTAAVFSASGRWFLTTSVDGTAKIWKTADRKNELLTLNYGKGQEVVPVRCGAFSNDDGKTTDLFVALGGEDDNARVWRLNLSDQRDDGVEIATEYLELVGHTASVTSIAFAPGFDRDGDGFEGSEDVDGDGRLDGNEDLNNNGKRDSEDLDGDGNLDVNEDRNGNGKLDPAEIDADGDGNADVFEDTLLKNGKLDPKEDLDDDGYLDKNEDANGNGKLDPPEDVDGDGNLDVIEIDRDQDGEVDPSEDVDGDGKLDVDEDKNGNGKLDVNEDKNRNGVLDLIDEDKNGNGILDDGEDLNGNNILDVNEDANGNGVLDTLDEDLDFDGVLDVDEDKNKNGVLDPSEDIDGDGKFDLVNEDLGNGILDKNEDLNGNGKLDEGEDKNGNGKLDTVDEDLDGDGRLDVHEDKNRNGKLDPGEDLDGDGRLDVQEDRGNGILDLGEDIDNDGRFDRQDEDVNGNGQLDDAEDRDGDGKLDLVNEDLNGNGQLDPAEDIDGDEELDTKDEDLGNGKLDPDEDLNNNGMLDPGEDLNGNGKLDKSEDLDGDGRLDTQDEDKNGNGKLDPGEDLDGDGNLDVNEDRGNGKLDVEPDVDKDGRLDKDEDRNKNGVLDHAEFVSTRIITGSEDNIVKLWDLRAPAKNDDKDGQQLAQGMERAKEILSLKGHTRAITSVSFSPDGRYVISSSLDGKAIVWLASPWIGKKASKSAPVAPKAVSQVVRP